MENAMMNRHTDKYQIDRQRSKDSFTVSPQNNVTKNWYWFEINYFIDYIYKNKTIVLSFNSFVFVYFQYSRWQQQIQKYLLNLKYL